MRIAITGSGGYLGSHLVRQAAAANHDVIAIHRPMGSEPPRGSTVQPRPADLEDRDELRRACEGAEAIIHAAGRMSDDLEAARRAILVGTENTLQASIDASVKRFVHVSSVSVYGDGDFVDATEDTPRRPGNAYGKMKADAEDLVTAAAEAGQIEAWILRPNDLYGPGDPNFTKLFLEIATNAVIPLFRGGKVRYDIVSALDCARGAIAAATTPSPEPGCVLHLNSGESLTLGELAQRLKDELGLPARTILLETNFDLPEGLPEWVAAFLAEDRSFSIEKARQLLDWQPQERFPDPLR